MNPALRTELRRGVGIWAALPMVAITIVGLLAHQRNWVGDWVGFSYNLRNIVILLGPAVVAAAAWQGGRDARRGVGDLFASTPRPPLHRDLAALASPTAWAVASLVVVTGAAAAVTASRASYGGPLVGILVSAASAVVALATLGYVAGRLVRWPVVAPLLALATYVVMGALAYRSDALAYLSPAVEITSYRGARPVWWWSTASTATFLLAAAGMLLLVSRSRRPLSVPLLALAVLAAVPIVTTGRDAFVPDPGSETLECRQYGGTLELCLSQVHSRQLDDVAAGLTPVLAGLDTRVKVVESNGAQKADEIRLNPLYVGPTLTSGPDLTVMRSDVANGLTRWGCGTDTPYGPVYDTPQAVAGPSFALAAWLGARPQDPPSFIFRSDLTDDQLVGVTRAYRTAAAACDEPAALRALAPLAPS